MENDNVVQLLRKEKIVYSVTITQTWNGEYYELDIAVDGLGDPPAPLHQRALIDHLNYTIRTIEAGQME